MLSRPYSLELRTALLSRTSFHVRGKLQRNRERITVHGRNDDHNKDLKNTEQQASTVFDDASGLAWLHGSRAAVHFPA